jgi:DNA-binding transcriptional MerR regulator
MPGPPDNSPHELPPIPSKRYFTIGEVSELCAVKPHVLRYWEQEFIQLKPVKRRGNRRYYQHHEVVLIRRIRGLLYEKGFTISGARAILETGTSTRPSGTSVPTKIDLPTLKRELEDLIAYLKAD